jgi:hypothetical protein
MATVTLNLDEELSKVTQEMAEERHASVDEVILDLLQRAAAERRKSHVSQEAEDERMRRWDESMAKLAHFDTGGPYTRDEMNER